MSFVFSKDIFVLFERPSIELKIETIHLNGFYKMATYRNWTGRDHKRKERKNLFWSFFFLRRRAKALYLVLFTEFCFWKKKIEKKATRNGREMIMKPFPIGWPSFHPHQFAEWKISEIMELPPSTTTSTERSVQWANWIQWKWIPIAEQQQQQQQNREDGGDEGKEGRKEEGRRAKMYVCIYFFLK